MRKLLMFASIILATFIYGGPPAYPEDLAYVLRFQQPEPDTLVQFDLKDLSIKKEIKLPNDNAFNNFVVDENGNCYISNFYAGGFHHRDIYFYDAKSDRIEKFIEFKDMFGPKSLYLNDKELIVEITGNDKTRLNSGVVFVDRETRKITGKAFLQEENPKYNQANINRIYYNGGKYLFIASFDMIDCEDLQTFMKMEYTGDIYIVDTEKKELVKILKMDKKYKNVDGVCNIGDKVYVAVCENGEIDIHGDALLNDRIFVYSLETGKLINEIKVSLHPCGLTYDKSVGKIYVQHRNDSELRSTVEIIDVKSDKVIGSIEVMAQLMFSVVKPGMLFITAGSIDLPNANCDYRLLVVDTKTDKIIKQFDGIYTGIAINKTN